MPSVKLNLNQIITQAPFNNDEIGIIQSHMLANIASTDIVFTKVEGDRILSSIPGTVIASPLVPGPNFSQDYLFHWVRDGAITMLDVIDMYRNSQMNSEKEDLKTILMQYLEWTKITQSQPPLNNISVYGEPKFNIDGSLWTGEWSRPQNDGPAIRAIATIEIAKILLEENERDYVIHHLYNTKIENTNLGIIKNDLEYVANHWGEKHAGLWEEIIGYHFFTEMVQRHALVKGADLAKQLGDIHATDYYMQQVRHIELLIDNHWNPKIGYYSETIKHQAFKGGGVNSSVILGVMYGKCGLCGGIYSLDSERVISSAYYIRYVFEGLYQINHHLKEKNLGPLIGRYPNDIYDGDQSIYGNPWLLTTAIFAGYYYALAKRFIDNQEIDIKFQTKIFFQQINPELDLTTDKEITLEQDKDQFVQLISELLNAGDKMLNAVKYFGITYDDGSTLHLSEQIDRSSGKQISATDLTWSYSTVLSAMQERKLLVATIEQAKPSLL